MFADNQLCEELTEAFEAYRREQKLPTKPDVSVMVLTASFWPVSVAAKVILPTEVIFDTVYQL